MLIRQIKKDGRLPDKKRITLAVILFVPTLLVFGLVFKQISDWRIDIQSKQEQHELDKFVAFIYEPLLYSQRGIEDERIRMQGLFQDAESMALEYPNHQKLIASVANKWFVGLQELWRNYIEINKEIRFYWILSRTNEGQNVKSKFSKRAISLTANNKKANKKYRKIIFSIRDDLVKSLDEARILLNSNYRPARRKRDRERNKFIRDNILPFSDATTAKLIDFIKGIDQRLAAEVKKLQELIRKSGQQSVKIQNYIQSNSDLAVPLTITINNWVKLENQSRAKLDQILYAIEAEYLAFYLELPRSDAAIKGMNKSLRRNIPSIVGKALKQYKNIDQSYNIYPRNDK